MTLATNFSFVVCATSGLLLALALPSSSVPVTPTDAANAPTTRLPNKNDIATLIINLYERGDYDRLDAVIDRLRSQNYQRRLARCVAKFGRAICENTVSFYLWAQMSAQQMMQPDATEQQLDEFLLSLKKNPSRHRTAGAPSES